MYVLLMCMYSLVAFIVQLTMYSSLNAVTISIVINCFLFFFSSRRRHTRCLSDWSSDVCSSDLPAPRPGSPTRRSPTCSWPTPRTRRRSARWRSRSWRRSGDSRRRLSRRGSSRSEERRVGKEGRYRGEEVEHNEIMECYSREEDR